MAHAMNLNKSQCTMLII